MSEIMCRGRRGGLKVSEGTLESAITQSLRSGDVDLPIKPEIVTRVLAISRNPDACFDHLSRLIHNDPALAAHVLRVANSPAFIGRVRITTLRQAVTRIGMRMLSELAITVGISAVYRVPGFEGEAEYIWKHALTTAGFAREVARSGGAHQEAAFLCGLLHSIGRPVVLRVALDTAEERGETIHRSQVIALLDEWDVSVGHRLGQVWDLPEPVRETIRHHKDFTEATRFRDLVAVIQLSSVMAERIINKEALTVELQNHPAAWELGIKDEGMEELIKRVEGSLKKVSAFAA